MPSAGLEITFWITPAHQSRVSLYWWSEGLGHAGVRASGRAKDGFSD
jgi:hypothetical protein